MQIFSYLRLLRYVHFSRYASRVLIHVEINKYSKINHKFSVLIKVLFSLHLLSFDNNIDVFTWCVWYVKTYMLIWKLLYMIFLEAARRSFFSYYVSATYNVRCKTLLLISFKKKIVVPSFIGSVKLPWMSLLGKFNAPHKLADTAFFYPSEKTWFDLKLIFNQILVNQ